MKKINQFFTLFVGIFILQHSAQAQIFQYQGSATQTDAQCYLLTTNLPSRSGTIWSLQTIDLSQSFDFTVSMNFGCNDAGADGIVFAFHQQGPGLVPPSGGGFMEGVTPSFIVELDTYQNTDYNDPAFDHIMITKNGEASHYNGSNILAAAVQASPTSANIEDCQPHLVQMKWDVNTKKFEVFFDCLPRISYTGDIVNDIFGGNPNVTWGYKASTGAYYNEQSVCIIEASFLNNTPKTVCKNINLDLIAPPARSTAWTTTGGTITQNSGDHRKAVFNSAVVGTYTVTATQTNYCSETATFTYTVLVEPCCSAIAISSATNTSCSTSCDGTATTDITTSPIGTTEAFQWSNGGTTATITGLCPAIYTVTVTDGNLCTQSYSVTVGTQATPTLNIGPDATYCVGATVTQWRNHTIFYHFWRGYLYGFCYGCGLPKSVS
jgi:Bacterial lectin